VPLPALDVAAVHAYCEQRVPPDALYQDPGARVRISDAGPRCPRGDLWEQFARSLVVGGIEP
jgi:hypothetical protein